MDQNIPARTSSTLVYHQRKPGLLPEFVGNTIESANCLSRIVLKTCQGVERAVDGMDEITTLMLQQQRERLLKELAPA